jgi:sensor histidine kinase YesM
MLPAQTGIGLSNVQARLRATFGPDYGLRIESQLGRGTTVTISLTRLPAEVRAA